MCWIVMADPSPSQVPPNGTLEAPLPPVRGFFMSLSQRVVGVVAVGGTHDPISSLLSVSLLDFCDGV